jgi:hypothetical protein
MPEMEASNVILSPGIKHLLHSSGYRYCSRHPNSWTRQAFKIAQYNKLLLIYVGLVKEFPLDNKEPPAGAVYQFIFPSEASASKVSS